MSDVQTVASEIFAILVPQARQSFSDVISDIDKHVLPTMAMIAQNLATIGSQLARDEISERMAEIETQMQSNAAASVLVGFANATLNDIQNILNALLKAVAAAVNKAVGVALL